MDAGTAKPVVDVGVKLEVIQAVVPLICITITLNFARSVSSYTTVKFV